MFCSNRFPVFLILMLLCPFNALVESSPIFVHHGKAVHHGNISSTVPLYSEENPTPMYITLTKEKSDEINDANPEELQVLFQDLTSSVRSASKFFKENRPSDAIVTLATSHIIDFNGVLADAGKKILAQNATLKQSADDMFTRLNVTFPDENTKHQLFVALSVGGVTAGGLAIKGMMTREVFEQNDALKWTFKAYDIAKRYVALGEAKDIPEGLEIWKLDIKTDLGIAISVAAIALYISALVVISVKFILQESGLFLSVASTVALMVVLLLDFTFILSTGVGGVITNNSDEDFTSGSIYVKHGDMKKSPPLFIPKTTTLTYLNEKNELVQGEAKNTAIFVAAKHVPSIYSTAGAISYQNNDGGRKYIFAWNGADACNVASSGTGKELVDNIGNLQTVVKNFPGGKANCTLSSATAEISIVKFAYKQK